MGVKKRMMTPKQYMRATSRRSAAGTMMLIGSIPMGVLGAPGATMREKANEILARDLADATGRPRIAAMFAKKYKKNPAFVRELLLAAKKGKLTAQQRKAFAELEAQTETTWS